MSGIRMNVDDIFGRKEFPHGELRLRRSKAVPVVLTMSAVMLAVMAAGVYFSTIDGRGAAVLTLSACAILTALLAFLSRGADVTLTREGINVKKGREETFCDYKDVRWYEYGGADSATVYMNDGKFDYRGRDILPLLGALRAANVPSYDPDDPDMGPECVAVKHIAGRRTAVIALLVVAALIWAFLFVPGLDRDSLTALVCVMAPCSLLLAVVAVLMWRQKIVMFEDCFTVRKAIGRSREYSYDGFAARSVQKNKSKYNYGSFDMASYNVTLYTNEGRKLVLQNALLMPELLERVGFDRLPFKD